MEFNYRYLGRSAIDDAPDASDMSFAPDTLREPAYFKGEIAHPVPFREAISALHAVVTSDLRFKPKDRSEYMRWVEQHEAALLAEYMGRSEDIAARAREVTTELSELRRESSKVLGPYYRAQAEYFRYLYKHDYNAWFVLDPVITVHPDEVFFECFSEDESSYGRLACTHAMFKDVGEFAYGTTNIDYSAELYQQFQKLRSYKRTHLTIEPAGFSVATSREEDYIEEKIDLPDSWVRGFLQVSSAMTLPATSFDLHPMDVASLCQILKRKREQHGPRSIRFVLEPGQPVKAIFEPWGIEIVCQRSRFDGDGANEIRIWGRRRLLLLQRLVPHMRKLTVHLTGTGLPSFYVADLGLMTFTLGLSGWTANDWSRLGNFDLMAPRAEVDEFTRKRVFDALGETWCESATSLSGRLGIDSALVQGALSAYAQAGRVIFDLSAGVYRKRELSRDPLPLSALRFQNDREDKANRFVEANLVKNLRFDATPNGMAAEGTVMDDAKRYQARLVVDRDERLAEANCECFYYQRNKLFKGPCEHILAVRIAHRREHGQGHS